ncbi:MAG: hypothetical protein ACRC9Q_02115, partial [Bacteroidales bacterium]
MQVNSIKRNRISLLLIALLGLWSGSSLKAENKIKTLMEEDSVFILQADEELLKQIRNMPNLEVGKGITFQPK